MKKIFLSFTPIILMGLSLQSSAQNYVEIGSSDWGVESIVKIQILDNENSRPIKNVSIKLMDGTYNEFTIKTDYNGIALIILNEGYYKKVSYKTYTLKVKDENYLYEQLEQSIKFEDYNKNNASQYLLIPDERGNNENWNISEGIPSANIIYNQIKTENYKLFSEEQKENYRYSLIVERIPGFYEINIRLNFQKSRHSDGRGRNNHKYGNQDVESNLKSYDNSIKTIYSNGIKLHVLPHDIERSSLHWGRANSDCENLVKFGYSDWRLPTRQELNILYENAQSIGNFTNGFYWSSEAVGANRFWGQSFKDGDQFSNSKGSGYSINIGESYARCVRNAEH